MQRTLRQFGRSSVARSLVAASMPMMRRPASSMVATAFGATSMRMYATHAQLHKVSLQELDEEESRDDKEPQPEVPTGWSLDYSSGKSVFRLNREFGDEKLVIECNIKDLEPKPEGEEGPYSSVTLYVTRSNNSALAFNLGIENNELVFDGVAHFKNASEMFDEKASIEQYRGPEVSELSEELVEAFLSFLEDRGVNDDMAEFVARFAFWMEQQEYEAWLKQIASFTK